MEFLKLLLSMRINILQLKYEVPQELHSIINLLKRHMG